jgi:CDP-glucose 4,6-dehydratase
MSYFEVFKNKKVLITGHTGFKGAWLTAWLKLLGAEIVGISLDIVSDPSHFLEANLNDGITDHRIDIRDRDKIIGIIQNEKPDFIFHLAAQSLVRESYLNPVDTWSTNLMGTLNVLEALRKFDKKCTAVIITSDKCYDNVEWVWGYKETDSLGGPDPYSSSKGAAELLIKSYLKSFFASENCEIRIASARAGNVIGGGDWAKDRIIPDCVKAWSQDEVVQLRNPHATRPWQHVLEPLSGYLRLAYDLDQSKRLHGEPFNFGPPAQQNQSVLELVEVMSQYWDKVRWEAESNKLDQPYESGLLKLNCDKALHELTWRAVMDFEETISMTAEWYKSYYSNPTSILNFTNNQLEQYSELAKSRGLDWA